MKLILFVSSMGAGGAERVAATLVNAWCRKGYEVTLLSTFSGRGECFYELHPSSRLVYLADLAKNGSKPSFRLYLSRLFALRKFVRVESPDTLVSFLPNVNIMVLGATLGLRKHTIICERTDPFQMPVNWALRFLRILMYPLASRFVVQTEAVKRKYNALWRPLPDITCIGNPIPEHLTEYK